MLYSLYEYLQVRTGNLEFASGQFVVVEPFLNGQFEKFNSNMGFEDGKSELLHCFSHWSHASTNGKQMVCDLQGKHDVRYSCKCF